jgi:flagellar motility protein MotE (MotC chaperone)
MRTGKLGKVAVIVACALAFSGAAPRYGFGMSTLKTWVNKVRPGTFPDLEAGTRKEVLEGAADAARQEALTETERQILLSLMERKRQLDERDTLLNQREEQLRVLRDNIQHQVSELKRLQDAIEASMDAKKSLDAENLKKVVALYNGMDSKRAAEKFQQLEPKVAVQILMSMNQRKAAALLEQLPPENAKRITEEIVRKTPLGNGTGN